MQLLLKYNSPNFQPDSCLLLLFFFHTFIKSFQSIQLVDSHARKYDLLGWISFIPQHLWGFKTRWCHVHHDQCFFRVFTTTNPGYLRIRSARLRQAALYQYLDASLKNLMKDFIRKLNLSEICFPSYKIFQHSSKQMKAA